MNKTFMTKAVPLILLTSALIVLLSQNMRKANQREALETEIASMNSTITELEGSNKHLQTVAQQLLETVFPYTVPADNGMAWCEQWIEFPYMPDSFRCSFKPGNAKIPLEMRLPAALKQQSDSIMPGLAPFPVDLKIEGEIGQMVSYLSELTRLCSSIVITQIALTPAEQNNRYSGTVSIAFPQINNSTELDRIQQFAKSSSRSQQ